MAKNQINKAAKTPVVCPRIPSLQDDVSDLQKLYLDSLSGAVPPDKARVALGAKKQMMRRFDWHIAAARMEPTLRPHLSEALGLPRAESNLKPDSKENRQIVA